MAEQLKLPADFLWAGEPLTLMHRRSGKRWSFLLTAKVGGLNQAEVDYAISRLRREYRRDRLYIAVKRDIGAFRWYQVQARARGYAF